MMVPKPLRTRLAVACVGCEGKPGYRTRVTRGCLSSRSESIMAVCCARCKRSARVLAPRMARKASSVPGVAPVNSRDFLRACQSASSFVVATPASKSEWPPMNLVADCRDTVAPNLSGCWFKGVAKVLSTATIAPGLRGAAQTASRSATVSNGFEGDSSQIRSATPQDRIQVAVSSTATRCTNQRCLSAPAAARPATP